jgi:hypothetical protein
MGYVLGQRLFRPGQAVIHDGRNAHVWHLPFLHCEVPKGKVPIMYDDEESYWHLVFADDLRHRFPRSPGAKRKGAKQ